MKHCVGIFLLYSMNFLYLRFYNVTSYFYSKLDKKYQSIHISFICLLFSDVNICFSPQDLLLVNCIIIYFWGPFFSDMGFDNWHLKEWGESLHYKQKNYRFSTEAFLKRYCILICLNWYGVRGGGRDGG